MIMSQGERIFRANSGALKNLPRSARIPGNRRQGTGRGRTDTACRPSPWRLAAPAGRCRSRTPRPSRGFRHPCRPARQAAARRGRPPDQSRRTGPLPGGKRGSGDNPPRHEPGRRSGGVRKLRRLSLRRPPSNGSPHTLSAARPSHLIVYNGYARLRASRAADVHQARATAAGRDDGKTRHMRSWFAKFPSTAKHSGQARDAHHRPAASILETAPDPGFVDRFNGRGRGSWAVRPPARPGKLL